jgi:hypothetical protein
VAGGLRHADNRPDYVLNGSGRRPVLTFQWPPLLREIVLGYLLVVIVTWATMIVGRAFLLPPSVGIAQAAELRVFPTTNERAGHWYRWIAINIFWTAFVAVTFALLGTLGFDRIGRLVLSIPTSFIQLVLILVAVWLRPKLSADERLRAGPIRATG